MNKKRVAIIGLGWLGMPLAEHLAAKSWQVKGTKRQKIAHNTIEIVPFELAQTDDSALDAWLDVDAVVLTVPPNRDSPDIYQTGYKRLVQRGILQKVKQWIFISSTGVFPQTEGVFDEQSTTEANNLIAQLEQWLLAQPIQVDILRLAGLIGKNRHPVRALAGKTALKNANQPVNLVHQTDCIRAITLLLEKPNGKRIFHLVAPNHPTRQDYYSAMATQFGLPDLPFLADNRPLVRLISGEKICQELGFAYQFPDPFLMPTD